MEGEDFGDEFEQALEVSVDGDEESQVEVAVFDEVHEGCVVRNEGGLWDGIVLCLWGRGQVLRRGRVVFKGGHGVLHEAEGVALDGRGGANIGVGFGVEGFEDFV